MSQIHDGWNHREASPPLTDGERLAVWVLRRVTAGARHCGLAGTAETVDGELARMGAAFRDLLAHRTAAGRHAIRLGIPESTALTTDERRLLDAIAAAQAEDNAMLDRYLHKLAPDHPLRSRLTDAVTTLAACLAVQGYWLPCPAESLPVPAAALPVARAHGRDMHDLRVAWP